MRTILKSLLLGALAVGVSSAIFAQTPAITLSMDSGGFLLTNKSGTALNGGTTASGDGVALQIGFYSEATVANPFAGVWTPFIGAGTSTFSTLSIGDQSDFGGENGRYAFLLNVTAGTPALPNAGQLISIRFYDATSIAGSSFFGSASSSLWVWENPTFPPKALNFSLDDPGVVWLGGNVATTATAVVIPEPSTYALILGGLTLGVVAVRRRLKK